MKRGKLTASLTLLLGMLATTVTFGQQESQQEEQQEATETKIIIIEEKVDEFGNRTTTKTVHEGEYTDEEIERIIEKESSSDAPHAQWDRKRDKMHMKHGKKGFLGVQVEQEDDLEGVLVTEVYEGSAAAVAGLQEGDVITRINDSDVGNIDDLLEALGKPGDEVTVHFDRGGEVQSASAVLTARDSDSAFGRIMRDRERIRERHHRQWEEHQERNRMLEKEHMMLKEQKPKFGVYLDDAEDGGVLVTRVVDDSVAKAAGLQDGDVITSFNGVEIQSANDLIEAVRAVEPDSSAEVIYLRDGETQTATAHFTKAVEQDKEDE